MALSCQPTYQVARQDVRNYQVREVPRDTAWQSIDEIIQPYRSQLKEEISEVVGEVEHELSKARPESSLGNFLADALLSYAQEMTEVDIDFACLNYGGVRVPSIPAGALTVEKIYEVMPFDNILVVLPLSGLVMKQLLDRIAQTGGWPISTGIHFRIDNGAAEDIIIGDMELEPEQTYYVALPDYIANGGDRCFFLPEIEPLDLRVVLIRDALIEWSRDNFQAGETISAELENRITNTPSQ